jgi:predicted GNAT family N-acyltransferase
MSSSDPLAPSFTVRAAESVSDRDSCFRIRTAVFVEEQQIPLEIEMDEYDSEAVHFLLVTACDDTPIGTARLLDKAGVAKIGRVAILKGFRGAGLGKVLMEGMMAEARKRGFREAMLDSQVYAIPFYETVGFVAEGEEFLDAGIPHYRMRREL